MFKINCVNGKIEHSYDMTGITATITNESSNVETHLSNGMLALNDNDV